MNTQLLVVGDQYTHLWKSALPEQASQEIAVIEIPSACAADISRDGVKPELDFSGWIILSFGTVDCHTTLWRRVHEIGFSEAVRTLAARYASFVADVKKMYPNVAVLGPLPTHALDLQDGIIGSAAERDLAVLVFTAMLQEKLAVSDIPVFSITEELLAGKKTLHETAPTLLRQINRSLGLRLYTEASPVALQEKRYSHFSDIAHVNVFDNRWLQMAIPDGARFITDVKISHETFSQIHVLGMATTWDGKHFEYEEVCIEGRMPDEHGMYTIHIERFAAKILLYGRLRPVQANELEFYVHGSQLSETQGYDHDLLLNLRDRTLADETVVFSAPPSMRINEEVIFSEPPGMVAGEELVPIPVPVPVPVHVVTSINEDLFNSSYTFELLG